MYIYIRYIKIYEYDDIGTVNSCAVNNILLHVTTRLHTYDYNCDLNYILL